MTRIITPAKQTAQVLDQVCLLLATKRKTKDRFFIILVVKKIITLGSLLNPANISRIKSCFNKLHVND